MVLEKLIRSAAVIAFAAVIVMAQDKPSSSGDATIHQFTVKDMEGKDVSLSKYKGDVVLIVNVASL